MLIVRDSSKMSMFLRLLTEFFLRFKEGESEPLSGLEMDRMLDYLEAARGDKGLVLGFLWATEKGVVP